jgi:hypothetical protein
MAGEQSTVRSAWRRSAPGAVRHAGSAPVCEIVVFGHGVSPLHFDGTISTSIQRAANTSIDVPPQDYDSGRHSELCRELKNERQPVC